MHQTTNVAIVTARKTSDRFLQISQITSFSFMVSLHVASLLEIAGYHEKCSSLIDRRADHVDPVAKIIYDSMHPRYANEAECSLRLT